MFLFLNNMEKVDMGFELIILLDIVLQNYVLLVECLRLLLNK